MVQRAGEEAEVIERVEKLMLLERSICPRCGGKGGAKVPSNLKKMVRARMAETGESYQSALRYVRRQVGSTEQHMEWARRKCPDCDGVGKPYSVGTGQYYDLPCGRCGGAGVLFWRRRDGLWSTSPTKS